jgi:competence protein ComEA
MKDFVKQHIYILLGIVCILIMGALFITSEYRPARRDGGELLEPLAPAAVQPQADENSVAYIVIHILGEVYAPGVYSLPVGARVTDAVEMAGGYTQDADLMRVNLAAPLQDAMQIIVPAVGDYSVAASGGGFASAEPNDGLINLNTATSAQLQTLPGIGVARAQSIIDYRESVGGFTTVEELMNISGIGTAIFANIREQVTIR